MRKFYAKTFFIVGVFGAFVAANAQTSGMPLSTGVANYPPIARAAHVSGDVTLALHIQSDGRVDTVTASSGPEMLRGAAINFVKQWKYPDGGDSSRKLIVHFRFKVPANGYNEEDGSRDAVVDFDDNGNPTITTASRADKSRSSCPPVGHEVPPVGEDAGDYVELFRGACMGSCPVYKVRVMADGQVVWNDHPFSEGGKQEKAEISVTEARRLLEAFRVSVFWEACGDYTRSVTDSASYGVEVRLNGRTKSVSEYADSAPDAIHDLEVLVDKVSDSHRWRVGDPKSEGLADIDSDSWLPKPGKTKLMTAAAFGKPEEVESALAAGDKLTDVDASGWTPLMYATAAYGGSNVKLLLDKGADVNAHGPKGETALIFAALDRDANEDLLAAGADVNAATREGVTALMLLAQGGDAKEIETLLKAGAKVSMKDAEGRTALDYLEAANCGKRIVSERHPWMTIGYSTCNAMDKDEFKEARMVLEKAGAKQTRAWYPER